MHLWVNLNFLLTQILKKRLTFIPNKSLQEWIIKRLKSVLIRLRLSLCKFKNKAWVWLSYLDDLINTLMRPS